MAKSSSIQALYGLCKKTFTPSGTPPASSQAIQKLCSLLDTFTPADVGLKEENAEDDRGHGFFGQSLFDRTARWAQPITFVDIHECDSFTMCIFCLPTSSVIPLHDHPGMTVLSKILYGSMHVKGYDWVEPACIRKVSGFSGDLLTGTGQFLCWYANVPHSHWSHHKIDQAAQFAAAFYLINLPSRTVRLAKLAVDKVLTSPCGISALYPKTGGNLHCFTAITPCAVLDVLAPPYREAAGRRCTYYHDYPYSSFSTGNEAEICDGNEEDYVWLKEIDTPEDLYMRSGTYNGPAIQI